MAFWTLASSIFLGGTEQIKKHNAKKVRTKTNLISSNIYDPISNKQKTMDIAAGTIGFITNPHPQLHGYILIAFSLSKTTTPNSLDMLLRTNAFVVIFVNESTFKLQFEIET